MVLRPAALTFLSFTGLAPACTSTDVGWPALRARGHDQETEFRARERTTGWPAAIVAQMQARGLIQTGAVPLETAVPPGQFLAELSKRGFTLTETVTESAPI